MAKKQEDNSEDKKPVVDEDKKKDEGSMYEERLMAVEAKVDQILEAVSGDVSMDYNEEERPEFPEKADDNDKPEDEDKKKEDDDDEEDKKKEHDDDEDEDKKKDHKDDIEGTSDGEPGKDQGEVKLPKAEAGETDESAPAETDSVQIMEKAIAKIVDKKVHNILKKKGFRVSKTPRIIHDIEKRTEVKRRDFAAEIREKVRSGKMSVADMNREVKSFVNKKIDEQAKEFFETHRRPEEI